MTALRQAGVLQAGKSTKGTPNPWLFFGCEEDHHRGRPNEISYTDRNRDRREYTNTLRGATSLITTVANKLVWSTLSLSPSQAGNNG